MGNGDDEVPEVPEAPATWENVVEGEIKHVVGRVLGRKDYAEEGEVEVDTAHEVRDEYEREREQEPDK